MKLILKLVFIFIFINNYQIVIAQNGTLDSIKKYTKKNIIRINLLNKYAHELRHENPENYLKYLEESLELSKKIKYSKGEAYSFYLFGNAQQQLSNFKKARKYYERAIDLFNVIKDSKGVSKCLNEIGSSYLKQGDYELAFDYYKKSLVINEKIKDSIATSISFNNLGIISAIHGDHKKALKYYNKSLAIEKELKNKNGIADVLTNIGIIYNNQDNYPLAIEFYSNALLIYKELDEGYNAQVSTCLYNIGLVYKQYENYEKALEFYGKSLKIEEDQGNKRNIAFSLMGMGSVYSKQNKQNKAIKLLRRALIIFTEIEDSTHVSSCLNNLGDSSLLSENYSLALKYYEEALKINLKNTFQSSTSHSYLRIGEIYYRNNELKKALSNVLNSQKISIKYQYLEYQKEAYELLSKIYYESKKYKKAYKNQLHYKKLSDSILNKNKIRKIAQLEYEYEYRERLSSAEKRETSLKEKVITIDEKLKIYHQQKLWGIIGFLSLVIILSIIIFLLRIKSLKTLSQNVLTEQKLLRSQMAPHFIFNSLSILQGIILNKEYRKSIIYLSEFSKLLRLTLENSIDKIVPLENELKAVKNYLTLQNLGTKNPYDYNITINSNVNITEILIPPMLIQPFVENTIEHAFKNVKDNKKISVLITFNSTNLICSIIDNGIGIDAYKKGGFSKKKSVATTITSERLKLFSKEFNLKTNISIKDRKYINKQGTEVILTLPYKMLEND